jgi:hypothetical protein
MEPIGRIRRPDADVATLVNEDPVCVVGSDDEVIVI